MNPASEIIEDIERLLVYLHSTPEAHWDWDHIVSEINRTRKALDKVLVYFQLPTSTEELMQLSYYEGDFDEPVWALTRRLAAVKKLRLKPEYAHLEEKAPEE